MENPQWITFHAQDKKQQRRLVNQAISAGAAHSILSHAPFLLSKVLRPVTNPTSAGNRLVSCKEQSTDYLSVWRNPLYGPYIYTLSSTPNDILALMVAMRLFLRALERAPRARWHSVYGGFSPDKLRDNPRENIPFLVLSNVPSNATRTKIETLRDILTKYDSIPRIVVTTGQDPIAFMSDNLKMPVNHIGYLGEQRKQVQM